MEDKNQMLSHEKPATDTERGIARDSPGSPDRPITRSPDGPICLPNYSVTRSPASNDCRECLAAMAHRLAQPMTALRGGIELGLMGKRSVAEYRSLLGQSLQLADNMAQLIVSLRDLAEAGAPGGPPQCVLLEAAAKDVLAEMEGLAQSRELCLQLKAEGTPKISANPKRLREALLSLLAWVLQNSAGGSVIVMELSAVEGEARVVLSPSRMDLQYLQIKVLQDITSPGVLFSHAAKNGALGWVISQRLLEGLGCRLEMLTEGPDAGCIRVSLPMVPDG